MINMWYSSTCLYHSISVSMQTGNLIGQIGGVSLDAIAKPTTRPHLVRVYKRWECCTLHSDLIVSLKFQVQLELIFAVADFQGEIVSPHLIHSTYIQGQVYVSCEGLQCSTGYPN